MDEERPPFRYDARLAGEIELRWQERWEREGTFHAANPPGELPDGALSAGFGAEAGKPKFYLLDFFPYPSGIGLHVGHPLGYIGTDVFGRYLRMTGHHVLHPFGFDTFGLPAEQYAIDTGQHPAVTVRQNAAVMRRQLRRLGLAHDRRREIMTSDPSYYRWTQWIFLRIFGSWYDPDAGPLGRARPVDDLVAEFAAGRLRVVPVVEDLQEDPLRPAVVGRVAGQDLAAPVVAQAQAPQLAAHDGRVVLHGDGRVLAGVDGVLLGGQPEGVEAERVQYLVPGHAQVPAEHVGADVAQRMADVQPDAARIGEEVQQVELGPPVRTRRIAALECPLPLPAVLPAQLDLAGQPRVVPELRRLLVHLALLVRVRSGYEKAPHA